MCQKFQKTQTANGITVKSIMVYVRSVRLFLYFIATNTCESLINNIFSYVYMIGVILCSQR